MRLWSEKGLPRESLAREFAWTTTHGQGTERWFESKATAMNPAFGRASLTWLVLLIAPALLFWQGRRSRSPAF